jgi:hypothetical protein
VRDESESLAVAEFEHVAAGPSLVLLRVNGRSSRPRPTADWRPTLVADHGAGPERFAPLPSPPDAEGVLRAAYSVPAGLVDADPRFWLELDDGQIVEIGPPTAGTPRRARPSDAAPAAESSDQLATLSSALADARERATRLQAENETLTATLQELEIWRAELERRLADTTTELAETRGRLTQAHAAAEMDALVARAEADALEQAARELIDAAANAPSGG